MTCDYSEESGQITCGCTDEYMFVENEGDGICLDIDECEVRNPCEEGRICRNLAPGYICDCPAGFRSIGNVGDSPDSCEDINECEELEYMRADDECRNTDMECTNLIGSYICCPQGQEYNFNTEMCEYIDRCMTVQCPENSQCQASEDGKDFECLCNAGYMLNDFEDSVTPSAIIGRSDSEHEAAIKPVLCIDIDECKTVEAQTFCGLNAKCRNTIGGYECDCEEGFERTHNGDDHSMCIDINECDMNRKDDTPSGMFFFTNTEKKNPCDGELDICVNTRGSFKCECPSGYLRNSEGNCEDINECDNDQNNCGANSSCKNIPGGFVCDCLDGYMKSFGDTVLDQCEDIDECITQSCADPEMICRNLPGSFACDCPDKTVFNEDSGFCDQVVELKFDNSNVTIPTLPPVLYENWTCDSMLVNYIL